MLGEEGLSKLVSDISPCVDPLDLLFRKVLTLSRSNSIDDDLLAFWLKRTS